MAPTQATFQELEQAALHIVRLIRDTRSIENTRLVVVGHLAVCKYLTGYNDSTPSIEFLVGASSSPGRVEKEIRGHPMTPLTEKPNGALTYRHTQRKWEVEVKITPDWLCPYLPEAARSVRDVAASGSLPYISLEDLVVFKADSCALRESAPSKRREALDAAALLELAAAHAPLQLAEHKLDRVDQALSDVVAHSGRDRGWWQRHLGEPVDDPRSFRDILSEMSDSMASPPTPSSPTTPSMPGSPGGNSRPGSVHSSIYSTMSRTSSSSSSAAGSAFSQHSASSSISSLHTVTSDSGSTTSTIGSPTSKSSRRMSVGGRGHRGGTMRGGGANRPLEAVFQNLEIERSASPGIALTKRI